MGRNPSLSIKTTNNDNYLVFNEVVTCQPTRIYVYTYL